MKPKKKTDVKLAHKGIVEQSSSARMGRAKSCFVFGSLFNNVTRSMDEAAKKASAGKIDEAKKALAEAETTFNELRSKFPHTNTNCSALMGQIKKIQDAKSATLGETSPIKTAIEDLSRKTQAMMDEARKYCS